MLHWLVKNFMKRNKAASTRAPSNWINHRRFVLKRLGKVSFLAFEMTVIMLARKIMRHMTTTERTAQNLL
jgi:hypothetical protein